MALSRQFRTFKGQIDLARRLVVSAEYVSPCQDFHSQAKAKSPFFWLDYYFSCNPCDAGKKGRHVGELQRSVQR